MTDAALTAFSSASANITLAPLPPSSRQTRLNVSAAAFEIAAPARADPVKLIISTSGWVERSVPTPPVAIDHVEDAGRNACGMNDLGEDDRGQGRDSEGLSTMVQPVSSAGMTFSAPGSSASSRA
jgi:hypothetical protein